MTSQAAVHSPSSERSDSSQSNLANGHEPYYPQTSTHHGYLHFPTTHSDVSPYRASIQAFENDLATLQSPSELDPQGPTELDHGTSQPLQPAPTTDAPGERPMIPSQPVDGVDHETGRDIRDPFPEQNASHTPPAHLTSPTSIYQDETQLTVPASQPRSTSTQRDNAALQPTSPNPPSTSALLPSSPSTSLPAQNPAFDLQRATPVQPFSTQLTPPSTTPQAFASHPPNTTTTTSQSQPLQPTTSSNSPPHNNHHAANPRDRRRRRFARWVRRRFRRQLPWLEGWLHGREGSARREAGRAIQAVERAFR